jgi:hypothetical protein
MFSYTYIAGLVYITHSLVKECFESSICRNMAKVLLKCDASNCLKLSDLFCPFLNKMTAVSFLAFKGPITLLTHPSVLYYYYHYYFFRPPASLC